jgi:ligand-binding sensor domain-containing protein
LAVGGDGQIIAAGERVGYYQDGRWIFLPQARTTGVRSLLVDGETLWVGSTNEIGRLTLPLQETSLYEKLKIPGLSEAGDIWYLARRGDTLIATTKEDIWFINLPRNEAKSVKLPNPSRLFLHSLDGKFVVTSRSNEPKAIGDGELLPILNPLSDATDRIWYGTVPGYVVAKAVYRKEQDRYVPISRLTTEGDRFLYTSVALWGNLLAITTYNKGLILFDPNAVEYAVLAQPSVVPSPAVAHAAVDRAGRLWVGTTRGISLLESFRFGRNWPTKEFPLSAFRDQGLLINYEDRA